MYFAKACHSLFIIFLGCVMMHRACQKQEQHRLKSTGSEMAARLSYGTFFFAVVSQEHLSAKKEQGQT